MNNNQNQQNQFQSGIANAKVQKNNLNQVGSANNLNTEFAAEQNEFESGVSQARQLNQQSRQNKK